MVISSKVRKFVVSLRSQLNATDIETNLEGCIGCGNCGNRCNWYLTSGGDQKKHPKNKADIVRKFHARFLTWTGRLLGWLGLIETPDEKELWELQSAVYQSCTMCGRCSMACPQGVANHRIMQIGRRALLEAGMTNPVIEGIQERVLETGHSYGLDFNQTTGKIIAEANRRGIVVPLDKVGSDWMLACSGIMNANFPLEIPDFLEILNQSGLSYTMSSRVIDTGTEAYTTCMDMQLGHHAVESVALEAKRLGCKGVIVGECGCDMWIYHIAAADIMKTHGIQVAYVDAIVLDLVKQGRIPLAPLELGDVTFHDPCWTARLTGYVDTSRDLLKAIIGDTIVEMTPNRENNYCCNGGGGMMRQYPASEPGDNPRRKASGIKAAQIRNTGAQTVVTPCTTCRISITDTAKHYALGVQVKTVADLLYASMKKALSEQKKEAA